MQFSCFYQQKIRSDLKINEFNSQYTGRIYAQLGFPENRNSPNWKVYLDHFF